jgi:hypothetical protein
VGSVGMGVIVRVFIGGSVIVSGPYLRLILRDGVELSVLDRSIHGLLYEPDLGILPWIG